MDADEQERVKKEAQQEAELQEAARIKGIEEEKRRVQDEIDRK